MNARPKILVVEDEPALLENIELFLPMNGHDVVSATDGAEAVKKLESERPDLMVLDVNLPEQSGVEVLQQMQREKDKTPVIIMSAHGRDNDLDIIALNYDAFYYLDKPFRMPQLLARINRALAFFEGSYPEPEPPEKSTLVWDSLRVDIKARQIFLAKERVNLPPTPFRLLVYLMTNSRQFFTVEQLMQELEIEYSVRGIIARHKASIIAALPALRGIIEGYDGGYIFNVKVVRQ